MQLLQDFSCADNGLLDQCSGKKGIEESALVEAIVWASPAHGKMER